MFIDPYRFTKTAIAQVVDPYFKDVVLFVDGEGNQAANVVQDHSLHQNTPTTLAGDVLVDYSDRRYGNSCINLPAGRNLTYQTTGIHQSFNFGTNDWTLEISAKINSLAAGYNLFILGQSEAAGRIQLSVHSDGTLKYGRFGVAEIIFGGALTAVAGQWYDFAFRRLGNTLYAYLNSQLVGTIAADAGGAFTSATVMGNGTGGIVIGGGNSKIAHVRVTRNIARTIAALTTPFDSGYLANSLYAGFESGPGVTTYYEELDYHAGASLVNAGAAALDTEGWQGRSSLKGTGASTSYLYKSTVQLERFDNMDFSIALNVHFANNPGTAYTLLSAWTDSPLAGWRLHFDSARNLAFQVVLVDGTILSSIGLRCVPAQRWARATVNRKGQCIWVSVDGVPVSVLVLPAANSRIKDNTSGRLYMLSEQGIAWYAAALVDFVAIKVGQADCDLLWDALPTQSYPVADATDAAWKSVALQIADSIADLSARPKVITNSGVVLSNTVQKFGKSMLYVGPGASMSIAGAGEFVFGTDDFTLELDYYNQNTASTNNALLCTRDLTTDAGWLLEMTPSALVFTPASGGSPLSVPVPFGQLVHVSIERRGQNLLGFIDHAPVAMTNMSSNVNISFTGALRVGKLGWQPAVADCYFGNLRITQRQLRVTPASYQVVPKRNFGKRYARWDRWDYGSAGAGFSNNDLTFVGSGAIRANVGLSSGKWYWEISSSGTRYPIVGVGTADAGVEGTLYYPGADAQGWSYFGGSAKKITGGVQTDYGFIWNSSAHVIGVYLDMDAGTLGFIKNGVDMGVAFTGLQGKTLYPMTGGDNASLTANTTANFGQTAFVGTPPAGYNAGVYEEVITTVPTYTAGVRDDYVAEFRLSGDDRYGDTVIIDSGRNVLAQSVTPANARYTSLVAKSGGTSLRVFATGQLLQFPSNAVFNLNIPRWTFRFWGYELAGSQTTFFSRRSVGTNGWAMHASAFRASVNGVWQEPAIAWARPATDAWHHYEMVKDGTTLYAFVDGALMGTLAGVNTLQDENIALTMCMADGVSELRTEKYFNDLEFWPGVAMHTANFAVPATRLAPVAAPSTYALQTNARLSAWFDASDAATLTLNGSNVTAWTEKISGQQFTQATAGNQPTLDSALMARNCVNFGSDATPRWLAHATGIKTRGIQTVFIVGYWANSARANCGHGLMGTPSSTAIGQGSSVPLAIALHTAADPNGLEWANGSGNYFYNRNVLTRNSPFVIDYQVDHAPVSGAFWVNGVKGATITSGTRFPDFPTYKMVGSSDTTFAPNGAIAEILVFDGFINLQDRQAIRQMLASKWKLP